MAQTRRRRRRKHRGTQSGRIDTRAARGRPRNRAEARARAQKRTKDRGLTTPTWRGAAGKGLIAAGIFFTLLVVAFGREVVPSVLISMLMLVFYIPMGYYTDRFFWRRRMRQEQKSRGS